MTHGWEIRSVRVEMKNSRKRVDGDKKPGWEVKQRKQEGMQASGEAARPSAALFPESRAQRDWT